MKLPSLLLGTTLCFFLFLQLVSSQTCSQRVLSFFDEPCTTNDDCYGPENARLYQCASGVGSSVCEMVYGSAIVNTFGKSCYNNTDCSASPFMAWFVIHCSFTSYTLLIVYIVLNPSVILEKEMEKVVLMDCNALLVHVV